MWCPLCERVTEPPGKRIGQKQTCVGCGCISVVPDGHKAGVPVRKGDPVPRLVRGDEWAAPCPACGAARLRAGDTDGWRLTCTGCGGECDGPRRPLDRFVDLSRMSTLREPFRMASTILARRWTKEDLGLAEADELARKFEIERRWEESGAQGGSPCSPSVTAEVVKWLILSPRPCRATAAGKAASLVIPLPESGRVDRILGAVRRGEWRTASEEALDGGSRFALDAGWPGLVGLDAFILSELITGGLAGGDAERALIVVFSSNGDASSIGILGRDAMGRVFRLDPAIESRACNFIGTALPEALLRLLCLKALFGAWATAAMVAHVKERAIRRRLKSLGGPCAARAAAWAESLTRPIGPCSDDALEFLDDLG